MREYAWRKGDLQWLLWPHQLHIYQLIQSLPPDAQTIVIECHRQMGKSFLGVLMATEDCLRWPGYSVVIVGPTIKQTIDIVHQAMRKLMEIAPPGLITRSKSESRWYVGKSEIVVGGFDVRTASRLRGKTALKIYIEEIVDSDEDQYMEAIRSDLGPMLTHSPCPRIIFLSTPPKLPDHPFLTETVPDAELHDAHFKFTLDDNSYLSQEQKDAAIKRAGGRNSIECRRELFLEVVRDGSVVVCPSFDNARNVAEVIVPTECFLQVTTDWGGVRDLTCSFIHTYDFLANKILVFDERVFPANTETGAIIPELKHMESLYTTESARTYIRTADVPGQLLVDLGGEPYNYPVQMPYKEDWQASINLMDATLAKTEILIHPRCRFLILSCRNGTFNKQKTDFARTKALGHMDALAALMYAIRAQTKERPWAALPTFQRDSQIPPRVAVTPLHQVADAMVPKSFASSPGQSYFRAKRLGSFKR